MQWESDWGTWNKQQYKAFFLEICGPLNGPFITERLELKFFIGDNIIIFRIVEFLQLAA